MALDQLRQPNGERAPTAQGPLGQAAPGMEPVPQKVQQSLPPSNIPASALAGAALPQQGHELQPVKDFQQKYTDTLEELLVLKVEATEAKNAVKILEVSAHSMMQFENIFFLCFF